MKTARYEMLGDKGEISGHVVFETGSRGQVAEIDEQVADAAIEQGFPMKKLKSAKAAKEEAV